MRSFTDLVAFLATNSGTTPFAVGAAIDGFRGANGMTDGATYSYSVQQGANYEVGYGTYTAATGTLTRTPKWSSHGDGLVSFQANATVCLTFLAEDIVDLIAAASGVTGSAQAAATAYGLQWALWFNAPPVASELLGLYVSPIDYAYPANFLNSVSAPPITAPTAAFTLDIDRQVGGAGDWSTIGTVLVNTNGTVVMATTGGVQIAINKGDRLRLVGPATVDDTIAGLAFTLKGIIP